MRVAEELRRTGARIQASRGGLRGGAGRPPSSAPSQTGRRDGRGHGRNRSEEPSSKGAVVLLVATHAVWNKGVIIKALDAPTDQISLPAGINIGY